MDFNGLLETLKRNREQPTIEEEALQNNECPYDAWNLKVNERGERTCPVCGRIWD